MLFSRSIVKMCFNVELQMIESAFFSKQTKIIQSCNISIKSPFTQKFELVWALFSQKIYVALWVFYLDPHIRKSHGQAVVKTRPSLLNGAAECRHPWNFLKTFNSDFKSPRNICNICAYLSTENIRYQCLHIKHQ